MMAPGIGMLGYSIGGLFGGGLLAIIGNREGSMVFGAISALAFLACGFVHNIYFILAMIFVALFSLGVVYLGKFFIHFTKINLLFDRFSCSRHYRAVLQRARHTGQSALLVRCLGRPVYPGPAAVHSGGDLLGTRLFYHSRRHYDAHCVG